MNGWNAFRTGLARALCPPWVLLILFAANLASGLLLAALPALGGPPGWAIARPSAKPPTAQMPGW